MKERNKQIDQIIQTKLKDYSSPSSDDLWDRIDAQRSKKEDDTAGIIWWRWALAGVAVLSVAVGLTLWSNVNEKSPIIENSSNNFENKNITATIQSADLTEQKSNVEDDLLLNIDNVTSIENTRTSKKQNSVISSKNTQVPFSSTRKVENTKPILETTNALTPSLKEASTSNELYVAEDKNPISESEYSISNIQSPIENNQQLITSNRELTTNHQQPEYQNTKIEATSKNYLKAIYLPTSQMSLLESQLTLDEDLLEIAEVETLPRGCYSFPVGSFKYDFYVDAIASAELTFRMLEAKDSEFSDYANNREATESEMYSYSTGVRLSLVTEGGVALRTGLIYNQILERFKYENGSATRTIIVEIKDADGNVIDTRTEIETGTQQKVTYNRYRSLDIPLLLGYEWHKEKMVYNINGGVYFNIWSKQKGEFLTSNANDPPIRFNSGNPTAEKIFHDRLGVSFYGSLGFNYKINDVLQLIVEPNVRYQFHSITVEDYPLEQKYINVGLMTGLRLQF